MSKFFFPACFTFLISLGCAQQQVSQSPSLKEMVKSTSMELISIKSTKLPLQAIYNGIKPRNSVLTIYIEGDGHTWDRDTPSHNPTPIDPIALKMALAQPNGAIAYIARPCQFINVELFSECTPEVWTVEQFNNDAISSISLAIDFLKKIAGAKELILIGYSGGAMVINQIASKRNDVVQIVTVAGNLNNENFIKYHRLNAIKAINSPADEITSLSKIPQVHFSGGRDLITPPELTKTFLDSYPSGSMYEHIIIQDNAHVCCWGNQWPDLWRLSQSKLN